MLHGRHSVHPVPLQTNVTTVDLWTESEFFWRPRCQKVELDHLYRLAEPDLARTPSFSREKSLFVQAGPAVTETPGCNTAVGHFNGLVLGTESVPEHKNAAKKSALASSFRRYAL